MSEEQCRICLRLGSCRVKLSDVIGNQQIYEIIKWIAPLVSIYLDDNYPQQLCSNCFERLSDIISFRSEIEKADEALHNQDPE